MGRPARDEGVIEEQRQRLLLAAAQVFSQHGYRAATMAAIAEVAGCSPPTLYTYFKSKAGLLAELVELLVRELEAVFARDWPAGLTLAQELELALRYQLEWAARRKELLLAAVRLFTSGAVAALPEELRDRDMEALALESFERRIARHRDELGSVTPREVAQHLVGLTHGDFVAWIRGAEPDETSTDAGLRARRLVHVLLHGVIAKESEVG